MIRQLFPKPADFLIVVLAVVMVLAAQCQAHAQELPPLSELTAPCAPDVEPRRALLDHEGSPGIWFHRDVAQCLLTRLRLLPEYGRAVELLEARVRLSDERYALRLREVELASQEAAQARAVIEGAMRRARAAEEDRGAWWRHPALWLAVGVIIAGAAFAAVASAAL